MYHKFKTSFTNKNATLLSTKRILFDMIKGCKSTLPQAFLQNCFSDQPYQQKTIKKLLLNYTQINIMA